MFCRLCDTVWFPRAISVLREIARAAAGGDIVVNAGSSEDPRVADVPRRLSLVLRVTDSCSSHFIPISTSGYQNQEYKGLLLRATPQKKM